MKKLSNVSPFLLLLFPVFIMMLFAFTTNGNLNQDEEIVAKTASSATNVAIKATTATLK